MSLKPQSKASAPEIVGLMSYGNVPGWHIEAKRCTTAARSDIRVWWEQAAQRARARRLRPALFYRCDGDEWRAVWTMGAASAYGATVESSPATWALLAGFVSVEREEVSTEGGQ